MLGAAGERTKTTSHGGFLIPQRDKKKKENSM
jgi:hypothetical protein